MNVIVRKDEKKIIPINLSHSDYPNQWSERINVDLAGEEAEVEIVGLVTGKDTDEKSLEAYITHAAPNTKSNVNVRAVLRDKSTFAFRGNVKIEKGAKGADTYLRSDALLFDEAKMGDDTPALEILEPDVKAGHAATVGKVDENMLFYLMSRGLTKSQAEGLLIEVFTLPIRNILRAQREVTEAFQASEVYKVSSRQTRTIKAGD